MEANVVILGGGVAGLIAALHCEEAGLSPTLIEAETVPGGRVRTDYRDGFQLDYGFQVLLTEYQEVQRYLDLDALELGAFRAGAIVFDHRGRFRVSDPLRNPGQLFSMAFSRVGTLRDKWLVFRLNQELKATDRASLFKVNDQTTLAYLKEYGFSDRIINQFFRPFFGGIFLENELSTPAGMFRFVFKMFGSGDATLPRRGIGAVVKQLHARLERTTFIGDTRITSLKGNQLLDESGKAYSFDKLILTTDPSSLMENLPGQEIDWHDTCVFYYTTPQPLLPEPTIGLVSDPDSLINNFCELTQVWPDYAPVDEHLISVTLKRIAPDSAELHRAIGEEVAQWCGKPNQSMNYLARYDIPGALPVNPSQQYTIQPAATMLTDDIYLAGDYLLNASLDAAMRSGRLAVEAMLQSL
jgi:protoporphyrinogen oxidase